MKKLMFVNLFLLFSLSLFCQESLNRSIWQAKTVYDTLGKEYPNEKVERFMFFENENNISSLIINEKLNMSTGEIFLTYLVDAYNLEKVEGAKYKVRELAIDYFDLVNSDSIYYRKQNYSIGFKRVNLKQSLITESQLHSFLQEGSIRKYYNDGESLNQIHSYKPNGKKEINIVNSNSNWETQYRVFGFEGFLFIKGIVSAPMIIENIDSDKLVGKEADYRYDIKNFEYRREKL